MNIVLILTLTFTPSSIDRLLQHPNDAALSGRRVCHSLPCFSILEFTPLIFCDCRQEEEIGVTDGSFKGVRYFDCSQGRAMFVRLSACRPDSRFRSTSPNHSKKIQKQKDTGQIFLLRCSGLRSFLLTALLLWLLSFYLRGYMGCKYRGAKMILVTD